MPIIYYIIYIILYIILCKILTDLDLGVISYYWSKHRDIYENGSERVSLNIQDLGLKT